MTIDEQLIDKLAHLARLKFSQSEKAAISNDLEKLIIFVQKMEEVNTDNIEPLQHISTRVNVWREDLITGSCSQSDALKNSKNHDDQFFLVPKMIKK